MASALVRMIPEELLEDARWHLREAERVSPEDDVLVHARHVRGALVFSVASVEAFVNQAASEYLARGRRLWGKTRDELSETRRDRKGGKRFKFVKLEVKLSKWMARITGRRLRLPGNDSIWRDFMCAKDFRNAFMHYKPARDAQVFNQASLVQARSAVSSASGMLERFYSRLGEPVPPWVQA